MAVHDPNLSHRVRRWLGLGSPEDLEDAVRVAAREGAEDDEAIARRALLIQIGAFHDMYRLPVTALTLRVAHDLAIGVDPDLASAMALRVRLHRPVTIEWLGEVAGQADSAEDLAALGLMIERLETSIAEFAVTASAARKETSDYGSALSAHIDGLGQVGKAGEVISELAALTKAMLARTREAERELTRSERETRMLQKRLDEARRTADYDHLTGLPNRKAFEARFEREHAEALLADEPLCVAFCDIDEFKRINDTHGHDAGDRVLKVVADTLAKLSNDRCHVARHGGEEFVAVLRGATLDQACARLDIAREDMARRKLVNRATELPFGTITFSAGVAEVAPNGDRSGALRAADIALYRAKEKGRNRVERAAPGDAI